MPILVVDKTGFIHATAAKQSDIEWFDNYAIAPNGVSILGPKDAFTIVSVKEDAEIGMLYKDGVVTRLEPSDVEVFETLVVTPENVAVELQRRLSVGFTYDFKDDRGKHLIATTDTDMQRWNNEVTPLAQANINLGDASAKIKLYTETGEVDVTSEEWFEIVKSLGDWRQKLFKVAFDLQKLEPIPGDYNADTRW